VRLGYIRGLVGKGKAWNEIISRKKKARKKERKKDGMSREMVLRV
jgi:hypothetical protein